MPSSKALDGYEIVTALYALTEEIARYHVEIIFQSDKEWQVCFSNPTAGPWKLIRIGGYSGGEDLRYIKEEDRPDLILFCKRQALFLIIEAKDSLTKFISGGHATQSMRKSIDVFQKETQRIDRIVTTAKEQIFGSGNVIEQKISVGYLFPVEYGSAEPANELVQLHSEHQRLVGSRDGRLRNCIGFAVRQDSSYVLHAEAVVAESGTQTTFPWVECLPQKLQGNVRRVKGG